MVRAALLISMWCLACLAFAQRSPFNGLEIPLLDSTGTYRLLIGGHFHGSSANRSGYPAATVLAGLDGINGTDADLLLSTGDLFLDPVRDSARYNASFFSRLRIPLFNAPGNHDGQAKDMPLVIERGSDRIILLDSERDDSDIRGDQLALIADAERDAQAGTLRNLFIVTHRPIWAEEDPVYGPLFEGNTRSLSGCNYQKEVYPMIERIATRAAVHWISGSMAGRAPAAIFFQRHAPNITYIQCAVRDELRDAMLIADVGADSIAWGAMSLTMGTVQHPSVYNAAWWRERQGRPEAFNWRLLPYLVKTTVLDPAFAYGAGAGVLLALLLLGVWKRIRSRAK